MTGMASFISRNPEVIEAYPLPDGTWTIIKDGKGSAPIPAKDFEAQYIPFVKG